jgi:putative flippase GtrA
MRSQALEISRYVINGLVATAVHYGVLTINIGFFEFKSAGLANYIAAIFGIGTSFLGSRYFVFKRTEELMLHQALKFSVLYGVIAIFHGFFLWIWTDLQRLDYSIGFLIATGLQTSIGYLGNKFLVFKV